MAGPSGDNGLDELRRTVNELRNAVDLVKSGRGAHSLITLPAEASSWNFTTFEKYVNQRFNEVTNALIAAEKAVDKAEGAQHLRSVQQNEFRESLSDLSTLMWTRKEGEAAIEALRREILAMGFEKKLSEYIAKSEEALNLVRRSVETRIGLLESQSANMQGRVWGISALFAIIVLVVSVVIRFVGH
jgi:hypothetical protein